MLPPLLRSPVALAAVDTCRRRCHDMHVKGGTSHVNGIRFSIASLLLSTIVLCACVGCSTSLKAEPGTVGATIAGIESAAGSHDWGRYATYWDLEAVGVMYQEDSTEI